MAFLRLWLYLVSSSLGYAHAGLDYTNAWGLFTSCFVGSVDGPAAGVFSDGYFCDAVCCPYACYAGRAAYGGAGSAFYYRTLVLYRFARSVIWDRFRYFGSPFLWWVLFAPVGGDSVLCSDAFLGDTYTFLSSSNYTGLSKSSFCVGRSAWDGAVLWHGLWSI